MKPLVLSARSPVADIIGFGTERRYLRLRSAMGVPEDDRDAALIEEDTDWDLAVANGYKIAVGRGKRSDGIPLSYLRLPVNLAEVGEGDVLGIQPSSGRVRLLYRRSSKHNFFLVTERCNNWRVPGK